jgi:hypothetical protein
MRLPFTDTEFMIIWSMSTRMMLEKSCLSCRESWGMHHRCPALGGRWNCC